MRRSEQKPARGAQLAAQTQLAIVFSDGFDVRRGRDRFDLF